MKEKYQFKSRLLHSRNSKALLKNHHFEYLNLYSEKI